MTCEYCNAGRVRWMHEGQYWHHMEYRQLVPIEGAKPVQVPSLGAVPDRVACKES